MDMKTWVIIDLASCPSHISFPQEVEGLNHTIYHLNFKLNHLSMIMITRLQFYHLQQVAVAAAGLLVFQLFEFMVQRLSHYISACIMLLSNIIMVRVRLQH